MSDSDSDDVLGELLGLSSSKNTAGRAAKAASQRVDSKSETPQPKRAIYESLDEIDLEIEMPETLAKLRDLPADMDDGLLDQILEEQELQELLEEDRLASIQYIEKLQREDHGIPDEILENPKNKDYVKYLKENVDRLKDFHFIGETTGTLKEPLPEWATDPKFLNLAKRGSVRLSVDEVLVTVSNEVRLSRITSLASLVTHAKLRGDIGVETIKQYVRRLGGSMDVLENRCSVSQNIKIASQYPALPVIVTVAKLEPLVNVIVRPDFKGQQDIFEEMISVIVFFLLDARVCKPYLSDRITGRSGNPSSIELLNDYLRKLTVWRYQGETPFSKENFKVFCQLLRSKVPRDEPDLIFRLLTNISDSSIPLIKYAVYWLCLDCAISLDEFDEYDGNDKEVKQKAIALVSYDLDLDDEIKTLESIIHSLMLFMSLWSNAVLVLSTHSDNKPLQYARLRIRLVERLMYAIFGSFRHFERIQTELQAPQPHSLPASGIFNSQKSQPEEAIFTQFKSSLVSLTNEYFVNYGGISSSHPLHGDCLLSLAALEHKLDRSISKSSVF